MSLVLVVSQEVERTDCAIGHRLDEEDVHDQACLVWSGREDLNLRPLRPERSALPGCATPRQDPQSIEGVIVLQGRGKRQPM
jgi:hypothetical protein